MDANHNISEKCFASGLHAGRIEAARQMGAGSDNRTLSLLQELKVQISTLCANRAVPDFDEMSVIGQWLRDNLGETPSTWYCIGYDLIILQSHLKIYAMLAQANPASIRAAVPPIIASARQLRVNLVRLSVPDSAVNFVDKLCDAAIDLERFPALTTELFELSEVTIDQIREHVKPKDVFLSHSERSASEADEITTALEKAGVSVWHYRRNAVLGVPHLQQTKTAVEQCKVFVCVVGENDWNSLWLGTEVLTAAGSQKPRFPVLIATQYSQLPTEMQQAFGTAVGVTYQSTGGSPSTLQRIVDSVKFFLG